MKKSLFFLASAALVLASCENDQLLDQNTGVTDGNQPKEIAFSTLARTPKRTIDNGKHGFIDGTTFDTSWKMTVSAVDVSDATNPFFAATEFAHNAGLWKGDPAKYWPLSPVQVNFLAIAHANANNTTGVTWHATNAAHDVAIEMSDNYAYNTAQRDLLYAIGNGQVTQNGNALSFPTKVDMTFKHTQAYLVFRVKAADEASENIAIKDIQIKGARTSGTATIARVNPATYANDAVSLNWTSTDYPNSASGGDEDDYNSVTPTQTAYSPAQALDDAAFAEVGHLLVVPYMTAANTFANGGYTDFKIIYTLNGNEYEYVYTPAATLLEAGKKYIFDITFKLHEILVNPTVTDWDAAGNTTAIYIPSVVYNESGANVSIGATAGSYTFTISNVPANGGATYSVVEGDTGTDFITSVTKTEDTTTSDAAGNITVTVVSTGGAADATRTIDLKLGDTKKMTITLTLKTTI